MISVLMATYRERLDQLELAVNSILQQEGVDFELLLVVDDPDNAEIRGWLAEHVESLDNVRVLVNEHNMGLPSSLNRAIDEARGEYLCRMDADDISVPGRLKAQLEYLQANDLDIIGGYVQVMDQNGDDLYVAGGLPLTAAAMAKASKWNNCMPHPTWFGKCEVFQQKYRAIPLCEDYDFQLRALLAGYKLGNIDDVMLRYRITEGSLSRSNLYRQYLYQRYITKCYTQGKVADIDVATAFVDAHYSDAKAQRYLNANERMNAGMQAASVSKGKAVAMLLPVPFMSLDHLDKMRRLALSRMA